MSVAMSLLTVAISGVAHAGAWESKTMQDPLPAREVERPLILSKGWLEVGVGADVKVANGYWSPSGEAVDFDSASFLYTTERVDVRYGLGRRADLYWHLPVHYIRLTNPELETDTAGWYWGDPRFGYLYELYRTNAPLTSVVARVEMKVPLGNEAPGSYIAGPSTFSEFITTTGTADLLVAAAAKRQLGPLAVGGELGYVYRFSGLAQYLIETENNQFLGRIKPGYQVFADVDLLVQAGPAAVNAGVKVESHSAVKVGTTSGGLLPSGNLEPIEGSQGWSLAADAGVTFNVIRSLDVVYNANIPLRGEDLMFFPIEDLHPTRGVTHSATLELRY